MTDETVDGDVRWADLSEWLRDRALVLRLVLCRGIFLAEVTPESDAGMWASSGTMPSEAIGRARRKVLEEGGQYALALWERSVLQAVAEYDADPRASLGWPPGAPQVEGRPDIEHVLEWRYARRGAADGDAWNEHSRYPAAVDAFERLDSMRLADPERVSRQWQVRAERAEDDR